MKKTIKALKFPIVFLLVLSSFIACDKEFSVIESDVLGKGNANFDTDVLDIPISAYNKKLNAIQISNFNSNLLGFFKDPEFGGTTASIVTRVTPSEFDPDFGLSPVIDSVILSIPYFERITGFDDDGNTIYTIQDSLYGGASKPIKLTIYRNHYFLRSFNPNSTGVQNYFSNANTGNTTDNLALTENNSINFDDHKGAIIYENDAFIPSGDAIELWTGEGDDLAKERVEPALRAKLDTDFWKTTFIDFGGSTELSNPSNFNDYFRGLYFKAEAIDDNGSMVLLNLANSEANITIYYTKGEDEARTQDTYTLNFNGNKLNAFINNYNMTFEDGNADLGDETLYLKGAEGSMAIVDLFGNEDIDNNGKPDALEDFISDFRKTDGSGDYIKDNTTGTFVLKKLINEAQLVIYEDESSTTNIEDYHKYDRIYAYDINNNIPFADYGGITTAEAQDPLNSKLFHLGPRDVEQKKYKIRLTQHLNNILLRDSTNTKIGLVLSTNVTNIATAQTLMNENSVIGIPAAAVITPRGTVLHGSNENVPEDKRMRLEVFFTDPENN